MLWIACVAVSPHLIWVGFALWLLAAHLLPLAGAAVFAAGVEHNEADLAAFARASQPLLSEYRKDPAIDALYRRIRDLA